MPWTHICVKQGAVGTKLDSIQVSNSDYNQYLDCTKQGTQNLQYVVNEIWNYGNLTLGGTLPANTPDLELSYRYNCDNTYNNCGSKEVYDFMQGYGLVRWTLYTLSNGKYNQTQQTI